MPNAAFITCITRARRATLLPNAPCWTRLTHAETLKPARCRGPHLVPVVVQAAQRDDGQRALAGRAADAALAQQPHRVPPIEGRPAARASESRSRKRSDLNDLYLAKTPPSLVRLEQARGFVHTVVSTLLRTGSGLLQISATGAWKRGGTARASARRRAGGSRCQRPPARPAAGRRVSAARWASAACWARWARPSGRPRSASTRSSPTASQ